MISPHERLAAITDARTKEHFASTLKQTEKFLATVSDQYLMTSFDVPKRFSSARMGDFKSLLDNNRIPSLYADGIFISGPTGRGKTRLAVAMMRLYLPQMSLALTGPDSVEPSAKFITSSQFVRAYGDAMKHHEASDLMEDFGKIRLMVLDDVGSEYRCDWALGLVAELLDTRLANEVCTIVTSNLSVGEMASADTRTASRLESMHRFEFTADDTNWRAV